jgi:pimeloyl-ACP methyl ester carboxylesterase
MSIHHLKGIMEKVIASTLIICTLTVFTGSVDIFTAYAEEFESSSSALEMVEVAIDNSVEGVEKGIEKKNFEKNVESPQNDAQQDDTTFPKVPMSEVNFDVQTVVTDIVSSQDTVVLDVPEVKKKDKKTYAILPDTNHAEIRANLKSNHPLDDIKKYNELLKTSHTEGEVTSASVVYEQNYLYVLDEVSMPSDPEIVNQWDITEIVKERPQTFSSAETLGRPVVVAVIDAGVDYMHEDLKNQMWSSIMCFSSEGEPIDGGCTHGYDFVDNDADPSPVDSSDHGTAVATIVGARTDNSIGIASLSHNRVQVMALRVAEGGIVELSNLIRAIHFAVNNDANVINLSLSGPTYSEALLNAIQYADENGVIVVVSAGNRAVNLDITPSYPASYDVGNVITVGAQDKNGALTPSSNYSPNVVDVVAPGVDILAGSLNNSYTTHSGTSFSAPIISAQIAQWISLGLDPITEIENLHAATHLEQFVHNGKTIALSSSNPDVSNEESEEVIEKPVDSEIILDADQAKPSVMFWNFAHTGLIDTAAVGEAFAIEAIAYSFFADTFYINWDTENTDEYIPYYRTQGSSVYSQHIYGSPGVYRVSVYAKNEGSGVVSEVTSVNFTVTGNATSIDIVPESITTENFRNETTRQFSRTGTGRPYNMLGISSDSKNIGSNATGTFHTQYYLSHSKYGYNTTYLPPKWNPPNYGERFPESPNTLPGQIASTGDTIYLPPFGSNVYEGSGVYNVIAVTDYANEVRETNELNNAVKTLGVDMAQVVINLPPTGYDFGVELVTTQTAGQQFLLKIAERVGYPVGMRIYIEAEGNTTNLRYYDWNGGNIPITLQNPNPRQVLKFTINGDVYYSNIFAVNPPSGTQSNGSVTIKAVNSNNTAVPGAQTYICADSGFGACSTKKTSDSAGKVVFSDSELSIIPQGWMRAYTEYTYTNQSGQSVVVGGKGNEDGEKIYKTIGKNTTVVKKIPTGIDLVHTPIVLVPGIMGSTVKTGVQSIPYLKGSQTPAEDLEISDPGKLLGWNNLIRDLENQGYVRGQTIIECPYDWRLSVDVVAREYLATCITKAKRSSGKEKVDIIAHSMGGLVARAYIQSNLAQAQNVQKLIMVGTPNEGATEAYFVWEGGDPNDWIREAVIDRTYKNSGEYKDLNLGIINSLNTQSTTNIASYLGSQISNRPYRVLSQPDRLKVKNYLQGENILGVKQLLPTYDFLQDSLSFSPLPLSNPDNQNELLLSLNNEGCADGICNEGSSTGSAFTYTPFDSVISAANIDATLLYGSTTGVNDTSHILITTPTAVGGPFYADGKPDKQLSNAHKSEGDTTVPNISTVDSGIAQSVGTVVHIPNAGHAALIEEARSNILNTLLGTNLRSLIVKNAVEDISSGRMNISTDGPVTAYLVGPGGSAIGVDSAGASIDTMTNADVVNINNTSSEISIDQPISGEYTLYLSGVSNGDYDFYIDYGSASVGVAQNAKGYHRTGTEVITFTLDRAATTDESALAIDLKRTTPVGSFKLLPVAGKTQALWSAPTGELIPTKYRLYSKLANETSFVPVSETTALSFTTTDTWAGTDTSILKQYRVSAVYADGTESFLSRSLYNNDSDADGLTDAEEAEHGTLVLNADTDGDRLPDGFEINTTLSNPLLADSDGNGISDYLQYAIEFELPNTTPVITLIGESSISMIQGSTFTDPGATAIDTEEGDLTPQIVVTGSVNTEVVGTYTITYTITDYLGGTVSATRSVEVISPNTPPTLTLLGTSPLTHTQGTTYTDAGATATDTEDGNLTPSIVKTGTVNTAVAGSYTLTYTVTDSGGLTATVTRTVNVVNTAPTVTLLGTTPMSIVQGTTFTDPGATASDTQEGNITNKIIKTGTVNTAVVGTYTLTYTVTDLGGLSNAKTRTVNVTANTAPTITLIGTSPVRVVFKSVYTDAGATANDAQEGDITSRIVKTGTVNTAVAGTYTLTYRITDTQGLTATTTRTVIVDPNTAPTITLIGATPLYVVKNTTFTDPGATATDTQEGNITSKIVKTGSVNTGKNGTYTLTYKITDLEGLSATVTRSVIVQGNTAPTITLLGTTPMTVLQNTTFTDPGATASDMEDGNITNKIVKTGTVNTAVVGTYTLTYKITDTQGLTATTTRSVRVSNGSNTAPTIALVGPATVSIKKGKTYTDQGATATDAEDGNLTASIVKTGTVDTNKVGDYMLTFTVTDTGGLQATVTRKVTVTKN